jgi:hypothetical protein
MISQVFAAPLLEERSSIGMVTQLHTLSETQFTHLN